MSCWIENLSIQTPCLRLRKNSPWIRRIFTKTILTEEISQNYTPLLPEIRFICQFERLMAESGRRVFFGKCFFNFPPLNLKPSNWVCVSVAKNGGSENFLWFFPWGVFLPHFVFLIALITSHVSYPLRHSKQQLRQLPENWAFFYILLRVRDLWCCVATWKFPQAQIKRVSLLSGEGHFLWAGQEDSVKFTHGNLLNTPHQLDLVWECSGRYTQIYYIGYIMKNIPIFSNISYLVKSCQVSLTRYEMFEKTGIFFCYNFQLRFWEFSLFGSLNPQS